MKATNRCVCSLKIKQLVIKAKLGESETAGTDGVFHHSTVFPPVLFCVWIVEKDSETQKQIRKKTINVCNNVCCNSPVECCWFANIPFAEKKRIKLWAWYFCKQKKE
uniref:(northern house mosquito) hypothetical protein n=1 Tax=Culex pipiens TaxID=7175 RepID=A0A8D8JQT8_CULPI